MKPRKNPKLVAYGRKGGKRRTRAKVAAARTNIQEARKHLLTRRTCKRCKINKLGPRNKSGVCRACQRAPRA